MSSFGIVGHLCSISLIVFPLKSSGLTQKFSPKNWDACNTKKLPLYPFLEHHRHYNHEDCLHIRPVCSPSESPKAGGESRSRECGSSSPPSARSPAGRYSGDQVGERRGFFVSKYKPGRQSHQGGLKDGSPPRRAPLIGCPLDSGCPGLCQPFTLAIISYIAKSYNSACTKQKGKMPP